MKVLITLVVGTAAVLGINAMWPLPTWVFACYALMSAVSLGLYAKDKSAARNRRWRVRESTLHLTAVLGGWPGALIAQEVLRHKTSKASFRAVFWATALVNIGLVAVVGFLAQ